MQFIVLILLMLSGTVFAGEGGARRFDVTAFGAVGDGVADDQPALVRAVNAVAQNKGGELYFPKGVYRCGRQPGEQNGIEFSGVSDVTIRFEPGAVLVMDNLNPQTGQGDHGHGIVFRGPCKNIAVINAAVKWRGVASTQLEKTNSKESTPHPTQWLPKPATNQFPENRPALRATWSPIEAERAKSGSVAPALGRSMGDAFRFEGFPAEDRCIANVRLVQCSAEGSPQTGAVLMGCSDVYVENFRVTRTLADGLHFNACRRVRVAGVTGIETGDDTLSFVTYEDAAATNGYSGYPGAFARADFGEWNSTGSSATDIYAKGGGANGVRLAGATNVAIANVRVEGKLRGVIADCGRKEGNKHSWSWLASRGITVSNVVAIGCTSGLYVANFNQPMTADDKWWRFEIDVANFTARDCKSESVLIADVAGVALRGVKAEPGTIRVRNARDCTLNGVALNKAGP